MSKNKFPDRLNWPDQSEFTSEDRNAVWDKIKHGEKKRTVKWLPYSLSAVAAAAAIFLIVQITGVEEQAPVDQPEEIDKNEESIEENVKPVEEQDIDMRDFEVGDELNGWTVTDIYSSEENDGYSYVKFDKTIDMTGVIQPYSEDASWPVFVPNSNENEIFPIDLDESQLRMQRRLNFYENYFEFEGTSDENIELRFSGIYINFDRETGKHNSEALLEVPIGPPYLQFDERSIEEKPLFDGVTNSLEIADKIINNEILPHELTPSEIVTILDVIGYYNQEIFFATEALHETYQLVGEKISPTGNGLPEEASVIEVTLSEDQIYIGMVNDGHQIIELFRFQKQENMWKITYLHEE
ncbi:hypothetical protein JMA_05730 [Jeotgalibacillus malaysiensis]|uniref:Uncharacterized protein n=1 Tax=Jeotgalibacillus malaysiensis TaxID=1508404 RepID=A0A0B5AHM9_9BACL|nr:hypothetical protein [Jeotgalibacillus malaysiensis]AJD89890.1 hypothetical protein JMA_05730 [Jeotgalibacillus malaysiensis]